MKVSQERLNTVLNNVANYFGIREWSCIESDMDETVENYFSILVPVTLVGVNDDGEVRKPIFIKFAPSDIPEIKKSIMKQHYEVEHYAYRCLFISYETLSNIDIHSFMPKCYYTDLRPSNEVIVMNDMRSEGFKRYEEKGFLDKDHVRQSLQALAKFHSLSIMYKEKGGDFETKMLEPYPEKVNYIYHLQAVRSLKNRFDFFAETDYEDYLKNLAPNFEEFALSTVTDVKFLVYGHGDFWKENILFKYEDNKPVAACLVDFQKIRRMSPAQDILLFLLTTVEVIDKNQQDEYLSIYFDELKRTLSENGFECPYSVDDLRHDMKVVAPYCVVILIMSYALWFGLEFDNYFSSKYASENYAENTEKLKNSINSRIKQLKSLGYVLL